MLQRSNGAAQYQSAPRRVHVISITSLHETIPKHSFSTRLLRLIVALVTRWNIQLQPPAEDALADALADALTVALTDALAEDSMILPTENLQCSLRPPDPAQSNT